MGGRINPAAAQRFIRKHEGHTELLQQLTDQKPAYQSALGRVIALSALVQNAEGGMAKCVTGVLYGGSLFLCHNIGNIVLSLPVALLASNMLMFAMGEIHAAALKCTVAGGLCARFEHAVFNAVTTDVLLGALRAAGYGAGYGAGYEAGYGDEPQGAGPMARAEEPACPA